jgi:hypothetical protein
LQGISIPSKPPPVPKDPPNYNFCYNWSNIISGIYFDTKHYSSTCYFLPELQLCTVHSFCFQIILLSTLHLL